MYKLSALDAGFLYNESERSPQHIASVQILELPDGMDADAFIPRLRATLLERIHLVPYFTNKLQLVPFGLDHPVWVRDTNFDIDNHLRRAEVAAPGGRAELEAKIAELHATRLDRSRPLWELWVLTGLEGGRIAYYNRGHHACMDGVSGQAMIEAIMDATPEPRQVAPAPKGFFRAEEQSVQALLAGAFENFARYQLKQTSGWMDHVETAARIFQRTFDPSKGLGAVADAAPMTRFNRAVHKERAFVTGELPLGDVKRVAKATGTKINDVFVAICSGALRRYLKRSGELPDESLIAGCPVSLRQPGDTTTNNQVTMMMVSFATNEADPLKRLFKIARSAAVAKHLTADLAASYESNVSLPGLPAALSAGAGMIDGMNLANLDVRLPCNVVVSNVPGPREQLYSNGARMLTHYPVSIPAHGQGVNITVQSYVDQLFFAITACARVLPDASALRDDMLWAFDELQGAVKPALKHADAAQQEVGTYSAAKAPEKPTPARLYQSEPSDRAA